MEDVVALPKLKDLRMLSSEIKDYPITALGTVQYAEHLGYDDQVIGFLKLFSERMIFTNRTDFIQHCSLLKRLFKEERKSTPERLKSPQD